MKSYRQHTVTQMTVRAATCGHCLRQIISSTARSTSIS